MNYSVKHLITIALAVLALQYCSAQEQISLQEAQDYAIKNAYSVQIARLDLKKAEQQVKETTAIGLPQINASGSFQNFLDIPVQVIPDFISPSVYGVLIQEDLILPSSVPEFGNVPAQFGTDYTASGGITASQLLFNGSYLIGLKAAKEYKNLAAVSAEKSEEEIKQTVTEAYHLCLAAAENLQVISEGKEILEKTLNDTKLLYENGFVEFQDVEQLELSMKSLNNQIKFAENQKTVSVQMLKFQMGLSQETNITLSSCISDLVNAAMASGIENTEFKFEENLGYKLAMSSQSLMELDIKNKKSSYLPSLNAFFSYQRNAQRTEFNFFSKEEEWFPSTVWGLNLNVPIFSSGMRKAQIQKAQIELEKANIIVTQAKEGAKLELISAKNNFSYAQNNLETSEASKELAESIFNKTQIKYNEGIASSFELNLAKNQLLESQGQYVAAVVNLLNSTNALNKALNLY